MTTQRKALDRAIEPLKDAYGNLERRYDADTLLVPPVVELDGDYLRWSFRKRLGSSTKRKKLERALRSQSQVDATRSLWKARRVPHGANLLREFAGLEDAPDERILRFARKWGVLGICRHGLPSSHSRRCMPWGGNSQSGKESVARWRYYSRRSRSLLLVASRLREPPRWTADGLPVFPWTPAELRPLAFDLGSVLLEAERGNTKESAAVFGPAEPTLLLLDVWQVLTNVVNEWLALGNVRPVLLLSEFAGGGRLRIVLAPFGKPWEPEFPLFGVLGMQLAFAVSATRGLAFCGCGKMFEPGRQPVGGARHYCDDCRESGAPQRDAARDYRARQRAKEATHSKSK